MLAGHYPNLERKRESMRVKNLDFTNFAPGSKLNSVAVVLALIVVLGLATSALAQGACLCRATVPLLESSHAGEDVRKWLERVRPEDFHAYREEEEDV